MTELQPTEVELTGRKKKPASVSKRKLLLIGLIILIIALAAALTAVLANRASKNPDLLQQQTLSAEALENTLTQ